MPLPRPHLNNVLMLNLTAVSALCGLVLVGLFFYGSGNLLPATQGADTGEVAQIWIMWGAMVAVPLITAVLWVLRLAQRTGD